MEFKILIKRLMCEIIDANTSRIKTDLDNAEFHYIY